MIAWFSSFSPLAVKVSRTTCGTEAGDTGTGATGAGETYSNRAEGTTVKVRQHWGAWSDR